MLRPHDRQIRILSLAGISAAEIVAALSFITIVVSMAAIEVYAENFGLIDDLSLLFASMGHKVGEFFDTRLVTMLVTMLFWALVGLVTYSVLWSFYVFFADIKNDISVSERFVHPRSFHKSQFWLAAFSRRVIVFTAYSLIVLYIYLLLRSLPYVYESVQALFGSNASSLPLNSLQSLLALGTWLLGWHLIVIVRRYSMVLSSEI